MASKEEIKKRIELLRSEMRNAGADLYLMTSTDPHGSEYVGEHFKTTEYISGCTSDNVVFIVDESSAHLWTDGRYFISAAKELEDTGVILMRMGQDGVETVEEFLESHLAKDSVLAFDGRCVKGTDGAKYRKIAAKKGASIESGEDLADRIWMERPPLPGHPISVLPDEIAGRTVAEKIADVRAEMERAGASYFILSKLDDIMWLLNIRGGDVENNPVALSYALIGEQTIDLFLQKCELTDELTAYARENRIKIHDYDEILDYIGNYHFEGQVLAERAQISDAMLKLLEDRAEILDEANPISLMKAVKNETEIENSKKYYLLDSVALCRFIYKVKTAAGKVAFTEWDAARWIDAMRAEIPGFLDLSFSTISAYNANAAMAHYQATEESAALVGPSGFLLVDSGGQYRGATTDVTRTISLGLLSEEMKRDFTLVAAANLSLLYARFAKGTTGCQLDLLAREPLFRYALDYNHGTGHGVGYILNVHEGPQRFSHTPKEGGDAEIVPGMMTSDEPGVYKEGRYGIRTESILLTVPDVKNEFGEFYRFEPLTFVPIDLDAIDPAYLQPLDRERLNDYHRRVREMIAPHLEGEELAWLLRSTEAI